MRLTSHYNLTHPPIVTSSLEKLLSLKQSVLTEFFLSLSKDQKKVDVVIYITILMKLTGYTLGYVSVLTYAIPCSLHLRRLRPRSHATLSHSLTITTPISRLLLAYNASSSCFSRSSTVSISGSRILSTKDWRPPSCVSYRASRRGTVSSKTVVR
jgi:hypothetical protein